jgi:hypothetical protein
MNYDHRVVAEDAHTFGAQASEGVVDAAPGFDKSCPEKELATSFPKGNLPHC